MPRPNQSGNGDNTAHSVADPLTEIQQFVAERGVAVRPYHILFHVLRGNGMRLDEIVRRTTLPRRAVEKVLAILNGDVEHVAGRVRLRSDTVDRYAPQFPVVHDAALAAVAEPSSDDCRLVDLLRRVELLVRDAPEPKHQIDHVVATPETVVRRAVFLHRMFALTGKRMLFLGDRDLTSLALSMLDPSVEISVADIDDDVLTYVERQRQASGRIRCFFADFRLGLPRPLRSWADLAVTDPPYTPDGVALFVRRGLEGLAELGTGRVVLAYGYGDQPGLGLKVQDALRELRLVYEAVLPAFNRYIGAQAIGSASNLYLLRATSATRRELVRPPRQARANVYTHGSQSLEGGVGPPGVAEVAALLDAAAGPDGLGIVAAIGDAWPGNVIARRAGLDACLLPATSEESPCSTKDGAVMVDLRHDSGGLLVRVLLAARAPRVAVLVRNQHPDITTAATQASLEMTVGDKYTLRFLRSQPAPKLAIVEAALVPPTCSPARGRPDDQRVRDAARRFVVDRPHGKLRNVCREALIASTYDQRSKPLTKNAARAAVGEALAAYNLDSSLLDLPRHAINELLEAIGVTATQVADRFGRARRQ